MSTILEQLSERQVVGVLRASTAERAFEQARASIEGGLEVLEITFTTPGAAVLIERLRAAFPQVLVGAGTVIEEKQLLSALESGASFIVSPHFDAVLVEASLKRGVPYLPGVLTPTEIQQARKHGCTMLKLFPIARAGGSAYLRDLLGPFPDLNAMVTGGIKLEETAGYLTAGAKAVGLGSLFADTPEETKQRTEAFLRRLSA